MAVQDMCAYNVQTIVDIVLLKFFAAQTEIL